MDKKTEKKTPEKQNEAPGTVRAGRLSLHSARKDDTRTVAAGSVRQSFSHGRSKEVRVEVRKPKRTAPSGGKGRRAAEGSRGLTSSELERRQRVLEELKQRQKEEAARAEAEKIRIHSAAEEVARQQAMEAEAAAQAVREKKTKSAAEPPALEPLTASVGGIQLAEPIQRLKPLAERAKMPETPFAPPAAKEKPAGTSTLHLRNQFEGEEGSGSKDPRRHTLSARSKGGSPRRSVLGQDRRQGRIDVRAAMEGEDGKTRSLASVRRQRDRERRQSELEKLRTDQVRVVRDVTVPEVISVAELANRMAVRQGDVIKALMKMGVMATGPQTIDADTAELVVGEFGHRVKRISESDVETGLSDVRDEPKDMRPRAPVVTVMGHVDHGKTTLLDALRSSNVTGLEAGGITQHIGAYQITLAGGRKITFIDTPGHEAFTAMRARGASVTDIVVLVVAADDGVMPQTVEAIRHAREANAPLIVAVNKMDRPGVNPDRVRNELLAQEVVVESFGGNVQEVPISALKGEGLDRLTDAILLQAEMMDLKANPNRPAEGAVIEGRLDRGRGPVATVLVQKGTLHRGDIVVAGAEWGRVRALNDDAGKLIEEAGPSSPVEVLGMSGVSEAGVTLSVVENENRAREIAAFRQRKVHEKLAAAQLAARGTLDQMLAKIQAGEQKELALLIKADVQGSAEAISAMVQQLEHEEVSIRVISASVGQITESDVQLAKASGAIIVAFNVRATSQARSLAQHDGVDIRYYSIIYQVAEDVEQVIRGRLAPKHREKFLGYAEVRQVFNISRVGRVAGCYVTEGLVKRGAGVRLLRDNVVIHEGELSQLKRFKDDVREVAKNYECGLSFAGFNNLEVGDVVECYEMEVVPQ